MIKYFFVYGFLSVLRWETERLNIPLDTLWVISEMIFAYSQTNSPKHRRKPVHQCRDDHSTVLQFMNVEGFAKLDMKLFY